MVAISRKLARTLRTVFHKIGATAKSPATVSFLADGPEMRIQCRHENWGVEYRVPDSTGFVPCSLPLTAFDDFVGADNSPVVLERRGDNCVVQWTDADVPYQRIYECVASKIPKPLVAPANFHRMGTGDIVGSLAETVRSTAEYSTRYALSCICLDGRTASLVATNGIQLLVFDNMAWPWDDSVLLPRTKLFDCKEFKSAAAVDVGRSAEHVVLQIGAWSVWLPIEKSARFPATSELFPKSTSATTRVSLPSDERAFLTTELPKLPVVNKDETAVTLHCNGVVAVRAQGPDDGPITELVLSQAKIDGAEVRLATDRHLLNRAARLGCGELQFFDKLPRIVALGDKCRFLWQTMTTSPGALLGPSADAIRITSASNPTAPINTVTKTKPKPERTTTTMLVQPKETVRPTNRIANVETQQVAAQATIEVALSPLAEAEALRDHLRDALAGASRVVTAIKRRQRQSKLVSSTLASLRQLEIVN